MSISIISKRTPPPPPHRGTFDRQLTILALLLAAASGALLLTACDSPTGENPNTNTNGGKVIPPKVTPPKVTPPIVQPTKTYTTTVKGKIVTPARAADPAKGGIITTARVWSSIDPANKVPVDSTDGSYSLQVAGHSGSFTITAEYTATGNRNYKTSDPKTVSTTGAEVNNQDIPLNYGHTTTVTIGVVLQTAGGGGAVSNGVTVVITAENGHEVGRGITSGAAKRAVITVDHPGSIIITASRTGYTSDSSPRTTTANATSIIMSLNPVSL